VLQEPVNKLSTIEERLQETYAAAGALAAVARARAVAGVAGAIFSLVYKSTVDLFYDSMKSQKRAKITAK
jgi:hypothetical protein